MGYYDPPEDDVYENCLMCGGDWWDEDDECLFCKLCGTYHEQNESLHLKEVWGGFCNLDFAPEPEFPWEEYEEATKPTPEDEAERELRDKEYFQSMGWMDEQGELTDAFFRAADLAYDCSK